tara:strand:+ start:1001 stop:1273 length:273 start_codon:yes stop_codon:yes gene_type:complete
MRNYKRIEAHTEDIDFDIDLGRVSVHFLMDRDSENHIEEIRFSHCRFLLHIRENGDAEWGEPLGVKELGKACGDMFVGLVNEMLENNEYE